MRRPSDAILRFSAFVTVVAMAAAACGGGSSETTGTLPVVTAFSERPVVGCNVGVGGDAGARVVQVISGLPADGVLEEGDVVLDLGGQRVDNAGDMVRAVQSQSPGTDVPVTFVRTRESVEASITLSEESVNANGQPLIGVSVITHVELARPETLAPDPALGGRFVRAVELEGALYTLDAVAGRWAHLADEAPDGWVGFDSGAWVMGGTAEAPTLDPIGSEAAGLALVPGEWELQLPLAEGTGFIVFLGDRASTDPASTAPREPALLGISTTTGAIEWEWVPGILPTQDAQWVPVNAFVSPNADRIIAALSDNQGNAVRTVVLDPGGNPLTPWPAAEGEAFDDLIPLGWYDDARLTFFDPSRIEAVTVPFVGGDPTVLDQLDAASLQNLWPVGDGRHLIAQSPAGLSLIDQAGAARTLAVDCETPQMGGIRFGA